MGCQLDIPLKCFFPSSVHIPYLSCHSLEVITGDTLPFNGTFTYLHLFSSHNGSSLGDKKGNLRCRKFIHSFTQHLKIPIMSGTYTTEKDGLFL